MTERKTWRCFHCDEEFVTTQSAREHFGYTEDAKPACLIANADRGILKQLREVERELANLWASVHREGTEAARAMLAQDGRHYTQLIRAEESGYARGIRDMKQDDAIRHAVASLAAAISLLERSPKKAAPSDKMFDQMLDDYRKALDAARNVINPE
ncbi:hypothetical protein EVC24_154 [Rhizobium phage RHph_I4]|nr:hypothetical protein EVC24_154 [Rhizobium phage RHph_I4]